MKKALFLSLMMALVLAIALPANAAEDIQIFIDGELLFCDVPPIIIEGRTLVPLRAIFEALDMTVDYDPTTKIIIGTSTERRIELQVNSTATSVTDMGTGIITSMTLDVPAQIIASRTLVPVRFVSESTGAGVYWDGPTRTVYVTTSSEMPDPVNEPPTALANPVLYATTEMEPLTIRVSELAVDDDLIVEDELTIVGVHYVGDIVNWGDFIITPGGLTVIFTSVDLPSPQTQYGVIEVSDGTYTIDVNIMITINPATVILPNLPPIALADPVEFATLDTIALVVGVDELAEDHDSWTSDELAIIDIEYPALWVSYGTTEIAPDGLSFTFTPLEISKASVQYMTVEVSDGTHAIDVHVEITISNTAVIINYPPSPTADPVQFSVFEQLDLVIGVYDLAWDLNRDQLTIVSFRSGLASFGTMTLSHDGKTLTFHSNNIVKPVQQYYSVTITDGVHDIYVNVYINISPIMIGFPINSPPMAKGDPVEFVTYDTIMLTITADELATDLNEDTLTIANVATRRLSVPHGTWTIASDGRSFLYNPDDVSETVMHDLVVTVSDGSLTTNVNVEIFIDDFSIPHIPIWIP